MVQLVEGYLRTFAEEMRFCSGDVLDTLSADLGFADLDLDLLSTGGAGTSGGLPVLPLFDIDFV